VYIYDVPERENERWKYAPYVDDEAELCRKAWEAFRQRHGTALNFSGEQQVIDDVHTDADKRLLVT